MDSLLPVRDDVWARIIADAAASDWLGTPVTAPEGAATFGPGYLVLIGLDDLDISENAAVRVALG